ncbi:MAG: SEC-C domain-containing protein [Anaerolineae bacterium]|nr:SEC-C domain-containing protein [Anaerolineae bacterium]
MATRLGRNDACHCGSGKKYKHCHAEQDAAGNSKHRLLVGIAVVLLVGAMVMAMAWSMDQPLETGGVWSPEHGHYHD